ncbi:MAG: hypothetical protein SFU98_13730 [Leptospiraceae bacterium]|nr:hypothetical protein [Leptospiraceae bacterium]
MKFVGGINIAMKVPKFKFQETVDFYEKTLGLKSKDLKAVWISNPAGVIHLLREKE